jgi:hypothetical protein
MAPLNDKVMKKWQALAETNIILGLIVLIVQVIHHLIYNVVWVNYD